MNNSHPRAIRGAVGGWSTGATRRNTQFLYSVMEPELSGAGYAVTLTLRDCPPDSDAWHRLRRSWEMRMVRSGMIRMHWVTEWQRRGCPHMHCAVWFPADAPAASVTSRLISAWLTLGAVYGAGSRGQDVHPITGAVGWFQYVSKHAARGVKHYQRSSENVPDAWKLKTGRMWGKVGDWPVRPKIRLDVQDQHGDGGWFAYRRLVRGWRVANARSAGDQRRVQQAKHMLACNELSLSRVRGFSEWISEEISLTMFSNLAVRGYSIVHTADVVRPEVRQRASGTSVSRSSMVPSRCLGASPTALLALTGASTHPMQNALISAEQKRKAPPAGQRLGRPPGVLSFGQSSG